MVINIEDKIDFNKLEKDTNGILELFFEYGGGEKNYHLYGRESSTGFLIPIGTVDDIPIKFPNIHGRYKKAAEYIIKNKREKIIGYNSIKEYILIHFSWSGRETRTIPK